LTLGNTELYEGACVAGLGIIQAPAPVVHHYIDSGQLVEIMPDLQAEPVPVTLLYANRRNLPHRTRTFMDWLQRILQPYLTDAPATAYQHSTAANSSTGPCGVQ